MTNIYYHRNKLNGEYYIGQTRKPLNQRFVNGEGYRTCRKFYHAIKKYGWNNFEHCLICICDDWEADDLERAFIRKYDSINNGYNLDSGGCKNKRTSDETKQLLSSIEKGHKELEDTKAKIAKALHGRHLSPSSEFKKGHYVSKETRTKQSIAKKDWIPPWKGKKRSREQVEKMAERYSIPIVQYSMDWEPIREWKSAKEAERELGIDSSHIGDCCKHKNLYLSSGGYRWIYKGASQEEIDKMKELCASKRPIIQYTMAGDFVREWDSASEAAKELGISAGNICSCCKHKRKSTGEFRWEYKNKGGNIK